MLLQDRPQNSLILLAKNYSQIKLENYWLPKYMESDIHKKIEAMSKIRMSDVISDVIYLRKKTPTPGQTSDQPKGHVQNAVSILK